MKKSSQSGTKRASITPKSTAMAGDTSKQQLNSTTSVKNSNQTRSRVATGRSSVTAESMSMQAPQQKSSHTRENNNLQSTVTQQSSLRQPTVLNSSKTMASLQSRTPKAAPASQRGYMANENKQITPDKKPQQKKVVQHNFLPSQTTVRSAMPF